MPESVGGISASVTMDDSTLDAGLSKLKSAIDSTQVQIGMLTAGLANGSISASEFATMMSKAESELKKLQASVNSLERAQRSNTEATQSQAAAIANASGTASAWGAVIKQSEANQAQATQKLNEATAAHKAHEAALVATMVPLSGLITEGLKYQDVLEKIRAAEVAANNSHGTMSAAGTRFAGAIGGGKGGGADGVKNVAMNMADVAVKSNIARQRLMAFGNTLDDLQYVGEMGLRPIINNVMQISPAIGIALLAFDQLRKHGEALEPIAKGVGEYWLGSFEKATGGAKTFIDAIGGIIEGLKAAKKWVADFGEGWNALTEQTRRDQEKQVKEFEETDSTSNQQKAKDVAKAIEAYGPRKFLAEAINKRKDIDPLLKAGDKDAEREEKARLISLQEKAAKGDLNAATSLMNRTKGTGVGVQIQSAMKGKETDAEKAAAKKLEENFEANVKALEEEQTKAIQTAVEALQRRYNKGAAAGLRMDTGSIANEIRRTGLPQAQGMLEPVEAKLRANFDEMIAKRMADSGISRNQAKEELLADEALRAKAEDDRRDNPAKKKEKADKKRLDDMLADAERINDVKESNSDLRYRLKNTLNPNEKGQSMGLDEYEASIKSMSGEDKLEKRMHEAVEILKKIKDNDEKIQVIARKKR